MNATRSAIGQAIEILAFAILTILVGAAPLLHGAAEGFPLLVLRVGAITAWTLALVAASVRGRVRIPSWPLLAALTLYVGLTWIGAFRSSYAFGSMQAALDVFVIATGFFLASSLVTTDRKRTVVLSALLGGAALMAVGGIMQALGSDLLPPPPRDRISSLFANPNHFAGLLDLVGPLALGIALFSRSILVRAACLLLAGLFYVNLGLTYSYGGWLASGTATVLLLLAWAVHGVVRHRSFKPILGTALLTVVALTAGAVFVDNSPRLRGDTLQRIQTVASLDVGSLRSRRVIQNAAFRMTIDHPWTGVGPGNYQDAIAGYRPSRVETNADSFLHRTVLHAMNDYLNVSTSVGFPGLAAFAFFWIWAILRVPRQRPALGLGILASLIAVLVHGLVDGNLTYVTSNAYLAFVLAGVLHARPEEAVSGQPS